MSDVKISDMPSATTPLSGSELVPIVQSGANVECSTQDIANLASGGGTNLSIAVVRSDEFGDIEVANGVTSIDWNCAFDGLYTVHFDPAVFGDGAPMVVATAKDPGSAIAYVCHVVGTPSGSSATIQIRRASNGAATNVPFHLHAIGSFQQPA